MEQSEQLHSLLEPIPNAPPGGEDLFHSYSPLYDQIREARRADDPLLVQGDWATALKVADWGTVRTLCDDALRNCSKDLQLALWYTEAMARQTGFAGATFGFRLIAGLLDEQWEYLYPRDSDERLGKLEWLDSQFAPVMRQIPLTSPEHGGYDWFHWQDSRDVENLQRRGGESYERALAEGRLTPEAFDKSARASGPTWYRKLLGELSEARSAFEGLNHVAQERFGKDAPSLTAVTEALDAYRDVAQRFYGGVQPAAAPENPPATPESPSEDTPPPAVPNRVPGRKIADRSEAIARLREVALYFRENEPHSPVALLAECAAKWSEMPVKDLLQTVIKNEGLHELLGISTK